MIVWGIRAKLLRAMNLVFECAACHTGEHKLYIFQRYFHLFWIPTFPVNRVASVECSNCKKVLEQKELVVATADQVKKEKGSLSAPIWMFSGLVLLAGGIGYGVLNERHEAEATKMAIESPAAGDIAVLPVGPLKLEGLAADDKVGIIRVVDVQSDQIHYFVASRVFRSAHDAKKNLAAHGGEITYFTAYEGDLPLAEYKNAGVYFVKRGQ